MFAELFSITNVEVILENYITPDSRFPLSSWTHPPCARGPATINEAEAFRRHFKQQFTSPHSLHPNIHLLSHILREHQAETYIKMQITALRQERRKIVKKTETVTDL